jgi:hypothetical protein
MQHFPMKVLLRVHPIAFWNIGCRVLAAEVAEQHALGRLMDADHLMGPSGYENQRRSSMCNELRISLHCQRMCIAKCSRGLNFKTYNS